VTFTSKGEGVVDVIGGQGRMYVATENALNIVDLNGRDEGLPLTCRPFWRAGFKRQQQCVFVNGQIYGFTGRGPTRSAADGNEGAEEHIFAARVRDKMAAWRPEYVLVAEDPKNRAVVYFHANDRQVGGFWVTECLAYMLESESWSAPMTLKAASADLTVTSANAVAGKLYFSTPSEDIYEWDAGTSSIDWFLASQYLDAGIEGFYKQIAGLSVTAKTESGTVGIFKNNDTSLSDLTTAPPTGEIALSGTSNVQIAPWIKLNLQNCKTFAIRVKGTWSGSSSNVARVDELAVYGTAQTGIRH
jgi:hypothetical protein